MNPRSMAYLQSLSGYKTFLYIVNCASHDDRRDEITQGYSFACLVCYAANWACIIYCQHYEVHRPVIMISADVNYFYYCIVVVVMMSKLEVVALYNVKATTVATAAKTEVPMWWSSYY